MANYTPGPWTATFDDTGGYDCMFGAWHIRAGVQEIAKVDLGSYGQEPCDSDFRSTEAEANAALLASAPRLLSALKALLKAELYADGEGLVYVAHCAEAIEAREAIAKATGQVPPQPQED